MSFIRKYHILSISLEREAYHTCDDGGHGKGVSKWFLIADAVLDDHNGCLFVHGWLQSGYHCLLVDSFMRADNVVKWTGYFVEGFDD